MRTFACCCSDKETANLKSYSGCCRKFYQTFRSKTPVIKLELCFVSMLIGLFIFDAAKLLRRKTIKRKAGRKKIKIKKTRLQLPLRR